MERNLNMEEVSDGKLYGLNDMVRAGCDDCTGCSACCCGMGTSIVLDPYDMYRLTTGLSETFEGLMAGKIELNVVDGMILPNLAMSGSGGACAFLNEAGRCSIHPHRPGICRLFPLGRIYENGSFRYFLQVHECRKENRSKVKVRRWIDTSETKKYEEFVARWHYFLKGLQAELRSASAGQSPEPAAGMEREKQVTLLILKLFYILPYDGKRDFYEQFEERMKMAAENGLKG